jgi:hypothetical protein
VGNLSKLTLVDLISKDAVGVLLGGELLENEGLDVFIDLLVVLDIDLVEVIEVAELLSDGH